MLYVCVVLQSTILCIWYFACFKEYRKYLAQFDFTPNWKLVMHSFSIHSEFKAHMPCKLLLKLSSPFSNIREGDCLFFLLMCGIRVFPLVLKVGVEWIIKPNFIELECQLFWFPVSLVLIRYHVYTFLWPTCWVGLKIVSVITSVDLLCVSPIWGWIISFHFVKHDGWFSMFETGNCYIL